MLNTGENYGFWNHQNRWVCILALSFDGLSALEQVSHLDFLQNGVCVCYLVGSQRG